MIIDVQLHMVREALGPTRGRGVRYTHEAQSLSAAYASKAMHEGMSLGQVSKALSVSIETLQDWLRKFPAPRKGGSSFRVVEVSDAQAQRHQKTDRTMIVCECPNGVRFTGLCLHDVIALMEQWQ